MAWKVLFVVGIGTTIKGESKLCHLCMISSRDLLISQRWRSPFQPLNLTIPKRAPAELPGCHHYLLLHIFLVKPMSFLLLPLPPLKFDMLHLKMMVSKQNLAFQGHSRVPRWTLEMPGAVSLHKLSLPSYHQDTSQSTRPRILQKPRKHTNIPSRTSEQNESPWVHSGPRSSGGIFVCFAALKKTRVSLVVEGEVLVFFPVNQAVNY